MEEAVRRTRIVAVVRGSRSDHLTAVVETLVAAGLQTVEITLNTPNALAALADLVARHPGVTWGAGTVLSPDDVHRARDAGARFVVAPNVNPAVGAACTEAGLAWLPGAATPTEIERAWSLGAAVVKVFPARSLGGPDYVREVSAPLNAIPLLPTGGVALDEIAAYLAAGAVGVGLGGALLGDALVTGDRAALECRARQAVEGAVG